MKHLRFVDIDRQGQPPVDQIHDKVEKFVLPCASTTKTDGTTDAMETLTKMPRFLLLNRGRHSDVAGLSRLGSDMAYKG